MSGSDSGDDFASAESDTEEAAELGITSDPHHGTPLVTTPPSEGAIEKSEAVVKSSQSEAHIKTPSSGDDVINVPPSEYIEPPSTNNEPPSDNIEANIEPHIEPPSANMEPPSANIEPPSANIEPPSANIEPPSANTEKTVPKSTDILTSSVIKPPPTSGESSDDGGGSGWGAWGGWGGSLWSSVSTVAESAQAIGKKVTSVIASVEDTLGVPSPEELIEVMGGKTLDEETQRLADDMVEHDVSAAVEPVKEEPHYCKEENSSQLPSNSELEERNEELEEGNEEEKDSNLGAMSGFLSGFAAASKGIMSGGLDALETLGKKTMEVLSEGDPGLAKKRAMLGVGPSSTLSQLLHEAKAENAARLAMEENGGGDTASAPVNYSRFFDEYHGVGHLEALELLSKGCATKTRSMFERFDGSDLHTLQEKLEQLSEIFSIEEDQYNLDDDSSRLEEIKEVFSDVTLTFKLDKLLKVSAGWREKVDGVSCDDGGTGDGDTEEERQLETDKRSCSEVFYENGIRSLAELTSTSIELFRKMAEMSLLPDVPDSDPLLMAKKFNRLTVLVTNEFDGLASVYSEAITSLDLEGTNSRVTSLYLESSNSGSYIQDAFQLLLPIFKLTLMQEQLLQEPSPNVLNRN